MDFTEWTFGVLVTKIECGVYKDPSAFFFRKAEYAGANSGHGERCETFVMRFRQTVPDCGL